MSAASLGRGVTISIDCKTDERFDLTRVERVLPNLVDNAAHYCNQGGSFVIAARPSSCGCPAAPDAFGCQVARRGLG